MESSTLSQSIHQKTILYLTAKARLDKDFEFEELNQKYDYDEKRDIFASLNCVITKLLPSPERKFIICSLKAVSSSLMNSQKLYSEHSRRYEKQETKNV